tara:strand:- start:249 stop:1544 length:1296 start_codon:yes stop_codon:yes gene_type:complete
MAAKILKLINWISSLKVAISLILGIAFASSIGTIIPQSEQQEIYLQKYNTNPWLGLVDGNNILRFELDHIYSSKWFLFLLLWLGIALLICSWRRQWPILKAALRWVDYSNTIQIKKLAIYKSINIDADYDYLQRLSDYLSINGWAIKHNNKRLAGRKGAIGRIGPPLIHLGIVIFMLGASWGAINGIQVETFLAPNRSFDLLSTNGIKQLTLTLKSFEIMRDPLGRIEQFKSNIEIKDPRVTKSQLKEISVNHPLRYKGLTVYQADWSLASINLKIGEGPILQLPLTSFPELGDQIWGVVIPTTKEVTSPVLISLSNEKGPVQIFDEEGNLLGKLSKGGDSKLIKGINLKVIDILTSSGLLLKRDPGVPLVYTGFAIIIIGGVLSIMSTKQIWAIIDERNKSLYIGGLSNRNLIGLAEEMPKIINFIVDET